MKEVNYSNNGKLLIVGGTGFIGVNVAEKAVNQGFQVSIISKNTCPPSKQLKSVEYIVVDITRKKDLNAELKDKNFNYVLNLVGYVDHADYSNGGSEVIKVHFNGVVNLVNCINKTNLRSFIQIGSSDEYGGNVAPQKESQREMPISPYSFAKSAVTHFLQMLYRTERYPVVILRPFLVYGVGQKVNRFIPNVVQGCINNRPFPVSSGEQLRDFCYIDDIVGVILLALINKDIYGEVINIASGRPVSIKHVINTIVDMVGSGQPNFGQIDYRNMENMMLYADASKAKKMLGWSASTRLEQGLESTINSIINNK
jgi:nucleoside-diphosphate-sugar epimerase